MHILKTGNIFSPTIIVQVIVVIILAVNYKDFKKVSDPISLKNGIILCLAVLVIIVLNTCITIYTLKIKTLNVNGIYEAAYKTLKMLFLIDTYRFRQSIKSRNNVC